MSDLEGSSFSVRTEAELRSLTWASPSPEAQQNLYLLAEESSHFSSDWDWDSSGQELLEERVKKGNQEERREELGPPRLKGYSPGLTSEEDEDEGGAGSEEERPAFQV